MDQTQIPTVAFCRAEAERYYRKYYARQQLVAKIEDEIAAAIKGINAQRYALSQDMDYEAHCGARNAFLAAAQLNATMALMLANTEEVEA